MTLTAGHEKTAAQAIETQKRRPEEPLRETLQPSRRTVLSWTLWAICWYLNGVYVMPLFWDDLVGQQNQVQNDNFHRFGTSWLVNFWGTGTNWVVSWVEKAMLLLLADKVMGRRVFED